MVQEGGIPIKMSSCGKNVVLYSQPKETKMFNGKGYVLEDSIIGDFAFIKGYKADTKGNVIFNKTAQNFNCDMAKAAKITIVEVEEILDEGKLDPNHIQLPGVYVNRVVLGEKFERRIERLHLHNHEGENAKYTPEVII